MVESIAKLLATVAPNVRELRRDLREAVLEVARENAVFKARIVEGYRITIPDAERESTGLEIGDLVQVLVVPLKAKAKR